MNKHQIFTNNVNTLIPDWISQKHWEEWKASGVSSRIIELNVRTLLDSWEVDKVLSRNSKNRHKHSTELVPCWQVSGIDPLTGERSLLGVQIKPDTPTVNKNGKQQKYIGATDYPSSPLFLDTGVEGYWESVINDKTVPIILTEGAKKAGAGLSIGLPTISIPGVSTCRKNGRLHHLLLPFTGFGRTILLAFDNDVMLKKPVQDALLAMGRELSSKGCKVMIIEIPSGPLKGMDDYIAGKGEDEFQNLFDNAITIEEWKQKLEEAWRQQLLDTEDEKKSKLAKYIEIVRDGWGSALKFNSLKTTIELNGEVLDINHIRLRIALEFDTDVPIGDSQAIVELIANENRYNPVVDYLDTLELAHPDIDTSILDNLATRYFGSDDPLHNIYMKKTLIAAVARARKPGCKHDNATILVGAQGVFKSTFWKVLFSEEWFSDELGDANEKDELMKLHRFWGLEWSEFESVYKRKDISALKKFMATTIDSFRTPYSRSVKDYPRSSVLVGSTNEKEILSDPTGNRRFWIIPVIFDAIPIDCLVKERDKLWAAANALYKKGQFWDLDKNERNLQAEANKEYEVNDPWQEDIFKFIENRDNVTTPQILTHLQVETARQDIGLAKRVSNIMRKLGWEQVRKRTQEGMLRQWIRIEKKFANSSGSSGSSGSLSKVSPEEGVAPLADINIELPNQQNLLKNLDHSETITQQEIQRTDPDSDPDDPEEFPNFFENSKQGGEVSDPTPSLSPPIKVIRISPTGKIRATASEYTQGEWTFTLFLLDGTEVTEQGKAKTEAIAFKKLIKFFDDWVASLPFVVEVQTGVGQFEEKPNCKCIGITEHPNLEKTGFTFETPSGEKIFKIGCKDFRLQAT